MRDDAPSLVRGTTVHTVGPSDPVPQMDAERAFLRATKRFASGVTVVAARTAVGLHGMTVSSFLFVSREPRLVLVSLGASSSLLPRILEAEMFAVSVLPANGQHLAERFAKRGTPVDAVFTGIPYATAITGAPVLAVAVAWFDCRLWSLQEAGDHWLVVGEVCTAGERDGEPLLYHRSGYARLVEWNRTRKAYRTWRQRALRRLAGRA